MNILIEHTASLHDCETFCERFLIEAITMWRTNACLKRSFNAEGGAHD